MTFDFHLETPEQTAKLAARIAPHLAPGDVLLLSGQIGAGKTHFARNIIQARQIPLGLQEDIPSPTFTLVQTYPLLDQEIWHADLYRLCNGDEILELGLIDAFTQAICLIEWPDRLQDLVPKRHLALEFKQGPTDDSRELQITLAGKNWEWMKSV